MISKHLINGIYFGGHELSLAAVDQQFVPGFSSSSFVPDELKCLKHWRLALSLFPTAHHTVLCHFGLS